MSLLVVAFVLAAIVLVNVVYRRRRRAMTPAQQAARDREITDDMHAW